MQANRFTTTPILSLPVTIAAIRLSIQPKSFYPPQTCKGAFSSTPLKVHGHVRGETSLNLHDDQMEEGCR